MMEESAYYTYVLIDPRTWTPFYIGKGQKRRMYEHGNAYTKKVNPKLYNKIQKIKSLGYKIIYEKWFESDDEDFCYWAEIYLIDFFGRKNLCNLTDGGEGQSGISPEVRAKMSAAKKGKPSPNKGVPMSESTKIKLRETLLKGFLIGRTTWNKGKKGAQEAWNKGLPSPFKGIKRPPEVIAKISASKMGHSVSQETIQKVRIARRGYKPSPETIEKVRKANTGKKHTQEVIARMSAAKLGHSVSEETREKLRQSTLKQWERKRNEGCYSSAVPCSLSHDAI